jgi:hypothetical protein
MPSREALMHYFSCLCGFGTDSIKSVLEHVTPNFCFFAPCGICGTKCILVRLGHKTSVLYFSCSGGPSAVFIKSTLGHVMPNLCFCIQWDLCAM